MFVVPNANRRVGEKALQVFDPEAGTFLPPEGKEVPATIYWQRRLKCGDVVHQSPSSLKEANDGDFV